jgi:5-oxopent-3-ene-1,2,5-tricarboxylate decarboxylase / 2-hydroxyhepta-2,4-diene-1,7-dioate isomerase
VNARIDNPSTVYGSLMHHRSEIQSMGEAAHQPPYNAPPQAPVLYIKPANTFNAFGGRLPLPAAHLHIQARSCVGLIYKQNQAPGHIERAQGAIQSIANDCWEMALLCDFSLPQTSFYRPPPRFNALDASLALPQNWQACALDALAQFQIETWVNGKRVHAYGASEWVRSAAEQLAAVSEFLSWERGDVLMMGCPPDAPVVGPGDVVEARAGNTVFTRTTIEREAV